MRKTLYIIFINLILAVLQNAFFPELFGANFTPNLILAFGFSFLFINKEEEAGTSLLIGGLVLDLLSFNTVGLSSLSFLILLEISILIRKYLTKDLFMQVALIFATNAAYILVLSIKSHYFVNYFHIFLVSLFTCAISLIFYFLEVNLLKLFTKSELGLLRSR